MRNLRTILAILAVITFSRLVAAAGLYTPFLIHDFFSLYTNPVAGSPNPVNIFSPHPGFIGRWLPGNTLMRLPRPANEDTTLVLRLASVTDQQDVEAIVDGGKSYRLTLGNSALTEMRIPLEPGGQEAGPLEVRLLSKAIRLPGDDREHSMLLDLLTYAPCPNENVNASHGALFVEGRTWPVYRDTVADVWAGLRLVVLRGWDAAWYSSVVREGYRFRLEQPQSHYNVNFFPLYPLLAKGAQGLFGGEAEPVLLAVANVLFVAAVFCLYAFVAARRDHEEAMIVITTLCFFPGALFFSLPYSESLLLLLTILFLWFADEKRWWAAAACAGLASATRMIGISFSLVFVYLFFRDRAYRSPRFASRLAGQGLLAVSGFIFYSAYQWYAFGLPFAASHVTKEAWKVPTADWIPAMLTVKPLRTLIHELVHNPFSIFHLYNTNIVLFFAALMLTIVLARKLGAVQTILSLSQLFLIYTSFAGMNLFSTTRYCAVIVPFFIGLGMVFGGRFKSCYGLLVAYFSLSLYLLALFWSGGILS